MARLRFHLSQTGLDRWLPTVVRYCGLALMGYAVFIDKGATPALIPAATGMLFFKNLVGKKDG